MAALMSAFGRMQTDRFGLMPIGSENVTTWWLGDRQLSGPARLKAAVELASQPFGCDAYYLVR